MTTTEQRRPRGRPRDPQADRRILAAAREVAGEVGVRNVTMSAIADRAGVGKPTIYLRWPNVPAVLVAALGELDIDPVAAGLAFDASLHLRSLRDLPHGAFLAECAALSDGTDEWAELLWGDGTEAVD